MPIMLSLENLEVKPALKSRRSLCRTNTIDGAFPAPRKPNFDSIQQRRQTRKPSSRVKKHVSFAEESANSCHTFDPIDVEPSKLAEFYVLPDELRQIKKEGVLACKEARRTGLATLLTEIYGTANDKDTQNRLNYWCRMASACRGLERFANEELSKRRNVYRKRAIVSVLEAQQQLKNEAGIDTANVLRRLSEAYTEQARMFAEKLGLADHQALQNPKPHHHEAAAAAAAEEQSEATASSPNDTKSSSSSSPKDANGKRTSRRNRAQRMQDRAAATAASSGGQLDNNGMAFRRNNTTMTAVVLQN